MKLPMKLPEVKLPIISQATIDKVLKHGGWPTLLRDEQPEFVKFLVANSSGGPISTETGEIYALCDLLYLCILLELENDYSKFKELLDRLNKAKVEAKVKAMNS